MTDGKPSETTEQLMLSGRNACIEAFRSGQSIEALYLQEDLKSGPVQTILQAAKLAGIRPRYVTREALDKLTDSKHHQGAAVLLSAFSYASLEDCFKKAEEKNEAPFLILLDGIMDPHNLGAIIRTANQAGAHGVIIPKNRAAGLTETVVKTSAGAVYYTPVVRVTNLARTIEELKNKGMWFVLADMGGTLMYDLELTGPIGLVIGSEGEGASRLVREKCDMVASIPMKGDIDSLNASVAAGILAYEITRQRIGKRK